MRDLGNIGGDAWNTPTAINEHGDVVGFANISPGSALNEHAFLWTSTAGIRDLGALPGDTTSDANGINNAGLIVGDSCASDGTCRGFVWQNGAMTNLQDLVTSGDDDFIISANDIDDDGRITGQAFDLATGTFVAFIAVPTSD